MTLLGLIIVLLIVGVVLAIAPFDPEIKRILYYVVTIVVVVVLVLFILRAAGIHDFRLTP